MTMMWKRVFSGILAAALCVLMLPISALAAEGASGTVGGLSWVLDSGGTLTISGSGAIPGASSKSGPWYDHREEIKHVVIHPGVTAIGSYAFYDCTEMTSVTIPASVTQMGSYAFFHCDSLQRVNITDVNAWMQVQFADVYANPLHYLSEEASPRELYVNGQVLTELVIPEGTTKIGPAAFRGCSIQSLVLPNSLTCIDEMAFSHCEQLTRVDIPDSVTEIRHSAFAFCGSLTEVVIPDSVTSIGTYAFAYCGKLRTVTIPEGITAIRAFTFVLCESLNGVTLPASVTGIERGGFSLCSSLQDIFFRGTRAQWDTLMQHTDIYNDLLLTARVRFGGDLLKLFSDDYDLCVEVGDIFTLSAGIPLDGEIMGDPKGITFQLSEGNRMKVLDTGIQDGCFYLRLEAAAAGITSVTFSDAATGKTATVPVTVHENNYLAYTIGNIPKQTLEGTVNNFFNYNGLYVDNYTCTVNEDRTASVAFDVYNTNNIYGIVEIYNKNGELYNAAVIGKYQKFLTGIYNVLGEGTASALRDWYTDNDFTYRAEMNSKWTRITLDIPENGYFKITMDPKASYILAVVDAVDLLAQIKALKGDISNLDIKNTDLPQRLTEQLLKDASLATLKKDGVQMADKLFLDLNKSIFVTPEAVGNFTDTLSKQLLSLNLSETIEKSLVSSGIQFAEGTFLECGAGIGEAMKILFTAGKLDNFFGQVNDLLHCFGSGWLYVSNQGGGFRSSQQIQLESDVGFDDEVALQTFTVALDAQLLEKIQSADPETYALLTEGIMHTYNISLVKNGEETQHSSKVTVHIPIPEDLEYLGLKGQLKVFRIEEDGSLTDMHALVEGDTIKFTTDHFSLYVLTGYEPPPEAPTVPETEPNPQDHIPGGDVPEATGGIVVAAIALAALIAGIAVWMLVRKKKKA